LHSLITAAVVFFLLLSRARQCTEEIASIANSCSMERMLRLGGCMCARSSNQRVLVPSLALLLKKLVRLLHKVLCEADVLVRVCKVAPHMLCCAGLH